MGACSMCMGTDCAGACADGYCYAEEQERQWALEAEYERQEQLRWEAEMQRQWEIAQAIEAQRAGTTKIGPVADESAVLEENAPKED